MYILKDKDNNILSYSKNYKIITDAKILLNMKDTVIEQTEENIVINENKIFLESDWKKYIESEEYKYTKSKEEAKKEIDALKKELLDNDYKIIKAYESALKNENPPYNMDELLNSRNSKRFRINELQTSFSLN